MADAFDKLLYRMKLSEKLRDNYYDHHVVTWLIWRYFKR